MPRAIPPIDRPTLTTLCLSMNDKAVSQQLGVTSDTIRWWRRKWGIPNAHPCPKNYVIDETFFSVIDTEEKAYILGFIAADGCVLEQRLTIALHPRDRDILERIRTCVQSTAPLYLRVFGKWPVVTWNTGNKQFVKTLRQYGIVPRKSLTLDYPRLPTHLERHYIRGLWDGDGHISRHDFCLTGSSATTAAVQQAIHHATGHILRRRLNGNIHVLRGSGRNAPVLRWLYENITIALRRKHDAYKAFWKDGTVLRYSLVAQKPYQLNLL